MSESTCQKELVGLLEAAGFDGGNLHLGEGDSILLYPLPEMTEEMPLEVWMTPSGTIAYHWPDGQSGTVADAVGLRQHVQYRVAEADPDLTKDFMSRSAGPAGQAAARQTHYGIRPTFWGEYREGARRGRFYVLDVESEETVRTPQPPTLPEQIGREERAVRQRGWWAGFADGVAENSRPT